MPKSVVIRLPKRTRELDSDSESSESIHSSELEDNDNPEDDDPEDDPEDQEDQEDPEDPEDEEDDPEDEYERYTESPIEPRLTARQRAAAQGAPSVHATDIGSIERGERRRKSVLSVEEQRIKRAELAKRRKNLSEKRLEEEKQDTLDRLLKRRKPKTKKDASARLQGVARQRPVHPAIATWRSGVSGVVYGLSW